MGPAARAAALLAILAAGASFTNFLDPLDLQKGSISRSICLFVYVVCLAFAFGVANWTTFISGLIAYRALPRHTFGLLQSKLFPAYFQTLAVTTSMALALFTGCSTMETNKTFQQVMLIASLCCTLGNLCYLEPLVTKVMFDRHKLEKEAGDTASEDVKSSPDYKAISKRFGMLHGLSSLANLFGLGCLYVHVWFLATKVQL